MKIQCYHQRIGHGIWNGHDAFVGQYRGEWDVGKGETETESDDRSMVEYSDVRCVKKGDAFGRLGSKEGNSKNF